MIAADKRHSYLARQVGTLALSHVRTTNPMAAVRAAAWANTMGRLGVHLPLFIVHDVGLLMTAPRGAAGVMLGPREPLINAIGLPDEARALLRQYGSLLATIAASEVVEKATSWRLRDDLVAVLLTKILGDLYHRWTEPTKAIGAEELPLDPQTYADADLASHFRDFDAAPIIGFLRFVASQQLHIYTSLEQIDLDTLRLLGVFNGGSGGVEAAAIDLVDLFGVFQSPEANDVVNFSLELLPSVLETKRASGVQTFAVDGYASIERRGNLDSLMLTEFAYDEELFERKVIDDELYYYGHEKQREEERRLQYILVDSSPSMRGVRQVFARGLALTLAKKLALQGDEVWLRFFDSRLYDTQKVQNGDLAAPYLLCFKSERGRNYAKVFRQLALELQRLRREDRRQLVVYILTHGQCHIPVEVVQQMRREAYLYGIFILPSSDVSLEYLDLLHRHQIVDDQTLQSRNRRRDKALEIVNEAGGRPTTAPGSPQPKKTAAR
ncbi:MAG: hypothetical protein JWN44_3203 [Myxococcales bacterium]|nr:hypothetical protein [Myxococcales bacterium]